MPKCIQEEHNQKRHRVGTFQVGVMVPDDVIRQDLDQLHLRSHTMLQLISKFTYPFSK